MRRPDDTEIEIQPLNPASLSSSSSPQPQRPRAPPHLHHITVISQTGYNNFLKSCCLVLIIFAVLIIGNTLMQQRGVLPQSPPPPSSVYEQDLNMKPQQKHRGAPAAAAVAAAAVVPDSSSFAVPAALSRNAPSIDMTSYWRQSSSIFQSVMESSSDITGDRGISPANGVYTESKLPYSPLVDQKAVFSCFDEFSRFEFDRRGTNDSFPPSPPRLVAAASSSSSSASPPLYRYDIVILPVGCWGDGLPKNMRAAKCRTTSCRGISQLSKFVSCGKRPIGLILGDNFYPNGIAHRSEMPRQQREFAIKFLRNPSLNIPFYGTVGNHDRRPQLQYRNGNDPFWIMPAAHHVTPLVVGDDTDTNDAVSVQVFLVSTQWGFDANYPHMKAEAEWLDQQLSQSSAKIKIVASHEPIFGFLGFPHSQGLVDFIHPVLLKHGVPLYISAHAHSVHFHRCTGGYHQLVSAGFADNLHEGVRYKRPRGHFFVGRGASAVAVNRTHVVVTAFDLDGKHLFAHAFDWKRTIAEVKGWNENKKNKMRSAIEEREVGESSLWKFEPVCSKTSRSDAPWCKRN